MTFIHLTDCFLKFIYIVHLLGQVKIFLQELKVICRVNHYRLPLNYSKIHVCIRVPL